MQDTAQCLCLNNRGSQSNYSLKTILHELRHTKFRETQLNIFFLLKIRIKYATKVILIDSSISSENRSIFSKFRFLFTKRIFRQFSLCLHYISRNKSLFKNIRCAPQFDCSIDTVYIDGSCQLSGNPRTGQVLGKFQGPTVLIEDHTFVSCLYKSGSHDPLFSIAQAKHRLGF